MNRTRVKQHAIGISLLVVGLLSCSVTNVVAQVARPTGVVTTNGLDVKCAIGFEGLCDATRPTSLTLLISNYTGKPIDGHLRLIDKWNGYDIDLGEVYLSEMQTRRFGTIQDLRDWNDVEIELRDESDTVIWNQELLMQKHGGDSPESNTVLVVEDGDRKLKLKSLTLHSTDVTPQQNRYGRFGRQIPQTDLLSTEAGTRVVTINGATWQIPTHHAPLLPFRAIILVDTVDAGKINGGQWKAIGDWVCLGGRIFIDSKATELVDELLAAAPLTAEPASQQDRFSVRPLGLGAIYEYSQPMFIGDSSATERTVVNSIAEITPQYLTKFATIRSVHRAYDQTTNRNRMWIIILFLAYTLFSGFVVLAMFRRTRRQVVTYLVTIVTTAAIGAGILGANLRFSKGEFRWLTISQPGAVGGIQIARGEASSSGARSSMINVNGSRPDLQVTGTPDNYFWQGNHVRSFTKRMNQSKEDQTFQTRLKITPWGEQQVYATDFVPNMKRLEVELTILPNKQMNVRIVNHLSQDIQTGNIVVMATSDTPGSRQRFFQRVQFATIAAGQSKNINVGASTLTPLTNAVSRELAFRDIHQISPPQLNRPNAVTAWVFAETRDSSSLKLDEERSDFRMLQGVHLFVQELLPRELPAWSEFGPFSEETVEQ